jgi:hypothetical protein
MMHHFQHELKSSIISDYQSPKYVCTIRWKIVLTVFWDMNGIILIYFLQQRLNNNTYCKTLKVKKLWIAVQGYQLAA